MGVNLCVQLQIKRNNKQDVFLFITATQFQHKILMNYFGLIHLVLGHMVYCTGVCVECKQGRGVSWWLLGTEECDFWTGRQGETPGTCPGPSSSSRESLGKVTHPLISTAAPKHAGYLGSLRIDLWLKKRMQSQGKGKQVASCKSDHKVSLLSSIKENTNLWLPWASKNSSSELSSESRAILCILHSEMLWRDGLAAIWHKSKKKKRCYFWACFILPLPFYTHIDTVTKKCCKNPPAHTQKVLYKHVTVTVVHGFTTDGVFYGQGGARKVWSIMTDKLKASTAKCHLKKIWGLSYNLSLVGGGGGCPPVCDVSTAAKNSPGESHMGEL